MLLFAKSRYLFWASFVATICTANPVNAQAPTRMAQKAQGRLSHDDVSIIISVSRSNLSQANDEAREIQATMPKALSKIFHKNVKIDYTPTKVTTKNNKYGKYQVTIAGKGKS